MESKVLDTKKISFKVAVLSLIVVSISIATRDSYKSITEKELANYKLQQREYEELLTTYEDLKKCAGRFKNGTKRA